MHWESSYKGYGIGSKYYSAPAHNIKTLTIRGANNKIHGVQADKETIVIDGPLKLSGNGKGLIRIEGGTGNDDIMIKGTAADQFGQIEIYGDDPYDVNSSGNDTVVVGFASSKLDQIGTVYFDGGLGTDSITFDNTAGVKAGFVFDKSAQPGWLQRLAIDGKSFETHMIGTEKITLLGGHEADIIIVDSAWPIQDGIHIFGNGGRDDIRIGKPSTGIVDVTANIFVNGGDQNAHDSADLTYHAVPNANSIARLGKGPSGYLHTYTVDNYAGFAVHSLGVDHHYAGKGANDQLIVTAMLPGVKLFAEGDGGNDRIVFDGGETVSPQITGFETLELTGGILNLTSAHTFNAVTQTGGVLDGTGNLTASNSLAWSGGTMQGTGRTIGKAANELTGALTLLGRTVDVYGTTNWSDQISGFTGRLRNYGKLTASGTEIEGVLENRGDFYPVGIVTVRGEFKHTAGTLHIDGGFDLIDVEPSRQTLMQASVVTLGGALGLPTSTAPLSAPRLLIRNGGGPVAGAFSGLPEGAAVGSTSKARINYRGLAMRGHDVVIDPSPTGEGIALGPINNEGVILGELEFEDNEIPRLEVLSGPSHGQFIFSEWQRLYAYLPDPGFVGTDSLTFQYRDSIGDSQQDPLTATFAIQEWNGGYRPGSIVTIDEESSCSFNASEADPPAGFVFELFQIDSGPLGTLTKSNETLTYTPDVDFFGIDGFTFTVSFIDPLDDTKHWARGFHRAVDVRNVNDAPTAAPLTITALGGDSVAGTVMNSVSDIDGDICTVSLISEPPDGLFQLYPNGKFYYYPPPFWTTQEVIEYEIDDGHGGVTSASFTLNFTNEAPSAEDDFYALNNQSLIVDTVLSNDFDENGDTLSATLTTSPANGTLTLLPNGLFIYKPNFSFVGLDSFTYTASDGHGGQSNATVYITVIDSIGPQVPPTGIDGNPGEVQHSRLTTITLDFASPPDAVALNVYGGIILTRTAATSSGSVGTVVQTDGANGRILVAQAVGFPNRLILTFDNASGVGASDGVEYGSLADGRWLLSIPSLGYHSEVNNVDLRRLFGDANANGTIDTGDFEAFGNSYGFNSTSQFFNAAFDFNQDGLIDALDFAAFGARMGLTL